MDLQRDYARDLAVWLENFTEELKEDSANIHKDVAEKAENLLYMLSQRKILDPSFLRQLEKEAEHLYSHYLHGRRVAGTETERKNAYPEVARVPVGGHKLPELPYSYDALEPYIDRRIMELHHSKHHQSYVEGLNKAEKELQQQRNQRKFELIKHWKRELAFNGAGHYLHSLFWNAMSPKGGGEPEGAIARQINKDFNNFSTFKLQFSEAAKNVEGGGWAILVWQSQAGRLEILTAEKHQNLSQWDVIPVLPLDVWEHAYYLQYENDRGSYVTNWWNVVNWSWAGARFSIVKDI
ncbi:superoxide dismutase [Evansella clarkii]|uniref:superoxide dismutase n=1 Tax=Evansella clarkii TaxID=79879 RepID=UPI000996AB70